MARTAKRQPNKHNPDFTWCEWNGTAYTFSERQSRFVRLLWQAAEDGVELADRWLLEQTGAHPPRVQDVFRGHASWGTMIRLGSSKGFKRLE